MFGYSMVQMVRTHANKLERPLREKILNLYKPFKWTPCFLYNLFKGILKKTRKISVIIEFEKDYYHDGCRKVEGIFRSQSPRMSCSSAELTPNGLDEILSSCTEFK